MSRIGKAPIPLPGGVKVTFKDSVVEVEGPKGRLSQEVTGGITIEVNEDKKEIVIDRPSDSKKHKSLHGLYRALVSNMVRGVVEPYVKRLEIHGVGYNAAIQGKELVLNIGFCHPVKFTVPEGMEIQTPRPTRIEITGIDKQKVGQLAAEIRRVRPPEPYNEKGIRYEGEVIRKKAGKTFVGGAT